MEIKPSQCLGRLGKAMANLPPASPARGLDGKLGAWGIFLAC
jgi:hypothetical protein